MNVKNDTTFGERLRAERERLGLSQAELGTAGGVARTSQHLYETDIRVPDLNYLLGVHAVGIDLAMLMPELAVGKQAEGVSFHPGTLSNIYRLVDEFCVDGRARPLPLEERVRMFQMLCAMLTGQGSELVDLSGIRSQLIRFTGT